MKDYLIVWFEGGEPRASELELVPESFVHDNVLFESTSVYLGDVDYLRDAENRLIGFSYIIGEPTHREKEMYELLLSQSPQVRNVDGLLLVMFTQAEYEIETAQALGSELYASASGHAILVVPNCEAGEVGFELTPPDDAPIARYETNRRM
jgi:hypothetical protein